MKKKLSLILIIHLMCMVGFPQIPTQIPNGKTQVIKKSPPLSNFNYGVIPQTANFSENSGYEYTYTAGACQQISGNAWVFLFSSADFSNQIGVSPQKEIRAFRFNANLNSTNLIDQAKTFETSAGKHSLKDSAVIDHYSVANIIISNVSKYYLFGEQNGIPKVVSYYPHPNVGFDTDPLGMNYSLTGLPIKMNAVTFNNKIYLFGGYTNSGFSNNIYEFKPSASNKFPIVTIVPNSSNDITTKLQVSVGKDAAGISKVFILRNGNQLLSWDGSTSQPISLGNISTTLKDEILTFSRVNTSVYINMNDPDQFIKEYPHILGDGASGTGTIPLKSFFYRGTNDWKVMDNKFTNNNQFFSTKGMIAVRCGKPSFLITPNSISKMIAP